MLAGCSITITVPPGERLLMKPKKTKIYAARKDKKVIPDFSEQIRIKPNRKILGVTRFHLRVYNLGTSVKDSTKNNRRVRRFLRRVGEPPVLFDSAFADRSANNINQFLFNHGYYHAETYYTVKLKKKRAKKLRYHVIPGSYYKISKTDLICTDSAVRQILEDNPSTTIVENKRIEFEKIGKERDRIFNLLRNNGYYGFKKDYIDFEIDTFSESKTAKIVTIISAPEDGIKHPIYTVEDVNIIINSDVYQGSDVFEWDDSIKIYKNNYPITSRILRIKQQVKRNELFNQNAVDQTYIKISELGLFDNIDIRFRKKDDDSLQLEADIVLRPGYSQSFSIEPQLISSDLNNQIANVGNYRNYGIANVFTYSNKNLFRGAERLDLSWTTRAETQFRADAQLDRIFTNFQSGVTAQLFLPTTRLWAGFADRNNLSTVRSLITMSYIYENNLDFNRNILPAAFSYQFVKNNSSFFLTPLEVFYSRSRIESGFLDKINPANVDFVKRLFASNVITSSGLRWNYTHFKKNIKDYVMLRTNIMEFGGNIHRTARLLFDTEKNTDTSYNLLGVSYFQFAKSEIDLRVSKFIDVNNTIAFRVNTGAALPYGNQDFIPFDKRFFIGGSNSLRGWRPRTVGPGSYRDTASGTRIDRSGELILQAGLEYRFKFIKPLELGLFFDAGNIWNLSKADGVTENEIFRFNRFYNELALNTGIGFRFDFDFFLFRLDWGIQLRDPEIIQNNGWVARQIFSQGWLNNTVLNLGIGYPF